MVVVMPSASPVAVAVTKGPEDSIPEQSSIRAGVKVFGYDVTLVILTPGMLIAGRDGDSSGDGSPSAWTVDQRHIGQAGAVPGESESVVPDMRAVIDYTARKEGRINLWVACHWIHRCRC